MKRVLFLFVVSVCFLNNSVLGQKNSVLPDSLQGNYFSNLDPYAGTQIDRRPLRDNKRTNVTIQMGGSFTSFGNNASVFTSFISPEVRYKVNKKLTVSVGTMAMYHQFSGLNQYIATENNRQFSDKLTQYYVFAKGEYKVNNSFRIRGTTMREFGDLNTSNPFTMNHIGFDWKIKDKLTLSADFLISKGVSPYFGYGNGLWGVNSRYDSMFNPTTTFNNQFFSSNW